MVTEHRAEAWVPGALGMVTAGQPMLPGSMDHYPAWDSELLHQEQELSCLQYCITGVFFLSTVCRNIMAMGLVI